MVVGAKVCGLTDSFLWCVCGLYAGILTSLLNSGAASKCKINTRDQDALLRAPFLEGLT